MNHDPLTDRDLDLLAKTRHAASRHLDIAPTPRDTLAVLRQAAEAETAPTHAFPLWAKWAFALLVAGIVLIGFQSQRTTDAPTTATVTEDSLSLDPGIDVAAWNVEIESLMAEMDASLDHLLDEDSDLNTMAKGLLTMEDNRL
jgi:hypothetical protein